MTEKGKVSLSLLSRYFWIHFLTFPLSVTATLLILVATLCVWSELGFLRAREDGSTPSPA